MGAFAQESGEFEDVPGWQPHQRDSGREGSWMENKHRTSAPEVTRTEGEPTEAGGWSQFEYSCPKWFLYASVTLRTFGMIF